MVLSGLLFAGLFLVCILVVRQEILLCVGPVNSNRYRQLSTKRRYRSASLKPWSKMVVAATRPEPALSVGHCSRMLHAIRHALTRVGEFTTHPLAFTVVAIYAVAWVLISPETFGWAAIATLATWLMTLFINRAEHRDTQALHAKLDELLRTHKELGPTSPCSMIKTSKILRSIASGSASGTCKSEPPPRSRNLRLNWRSASLAIR
jgi:hypothetical protein